MIIDVSVQVYLILHDTSLATCLAWDWTALGMTEHARALAINGVS